MKCPFCKKEFPTPELPRMGLVRCPNCHQAFMPNWQEGNNDKNRLQGNS